MPPPKDHICDVCGVTLSEHSGGEATCKDKAICEYCGSEYGELDSNNHNLEKIPAKDATVTATGNKEYWHCKDCGKYFADENGTNEIELSDTVTQKLPPEIIKGKGQSITAGEKKELTFRSNAAHQHHASTYLQGAEALLYQGPSAESNLPPQRDHQRCTDGDKTETTDLNQYQQHQLAEGSPVGKGVVHHKPGHAGCGYRCKQCTEKGRLLPGLRGYGQHQQQGSYHNNTEKTEYNCL